jgi:tetratricopeptide (TPR) repeat protein
MSESELDATFAARGHTVDYLLKSLRDQIRAGTLSSFVVTGPRGAGKSTVIRMVALRLKRDAELSRAWLPVVFPEEQFSVASLRDFLAAILRELSASGLPEAQAWVEKVETESNDEQSQQLAVTGLREITRKTDKRLVVFVENLNLLLEECLDDQMKGTLRRLLMKDPFMLLIGSSVHVFDSLKRYDEAFFNYFGPVPLDRLSAEQVFELLQRRAAFDGNDRFLRDFGEQRPKIRAIVHLAGGNPRLILMLYELLSQRQVTTIVQYLRRLVDELTPLLKDEMENLPPQQRKIVHALMEKGGTAQPVDLVERTRLPLNAITTQLKRLKDAQIVEVLGGGKGRAANYTVPDKLFAIWYQMRYLNQNRRRIELFVEVLRIWFEAEERFATIQSFARLQNWASPNALHEAALTTEYFAASLADTPYASEARDHTVRQWLKSGDYREAALAHADFTRLAAREGMSFESTAYVLLGRWCAEHTDLETALSVLNSIINDEDQPASERAAALLERGRCFDISGDHQQARADFAAVLALKGAFEQQTPEELVNRGFAKWRVGDTRGALADYTTLVTLAGAPKEQVVAALVNRGVAKEGLGDTQGAMADYTAVVTLEGAPKEGVAQALFNRGVAKGRLGDTQGAMADYTVVVTLEGAPKAVLAQALVNRGVAKGRLGDTQGAMGDCTAVIALEGVPKEQLARALFNRGLAKATLGDTQGALTDYTAVVTLRGAPKEQVAHALVNRGVAKGRLGDTQGELADYTAVVALEGAPTEQVAGALFNRGVATGMLGDRQGALADYTAMVALAGAPKELVAGALFNRGSARGMLGDTQGELADYTAVVALQGAPKEQVARALVNRGGAKGRLGDNQGALADFTAVVALNGAPKEQVAQALFNRGLAKGKLGNNQGALADYTEVAALEGAPKEQVAWALLNRGGAKGRLGDHQGELADYTAVVTLQGASTEQVVQALVNRGVAKGRLGDIQGALADYTAVVAMKTVSKEQLAKALLNRGFTYVALGQKASAIADWTVVLEVETNFEDGVSLAAHNLFSLYWRDGATNQANNTLARLAQHLSAKPADHRALKLAEFLARLASPPMRQGWLHAARRLLGAQPPETRQALGFLEPVCAVLEGGEKSLLDPLPPEQREFALKVLARFDTEKNSPAAPPSAIGDSPKPDSKKIKKTRGPLNRCGAGIPRKT